MVGWYVLGGIVLLLLIIWLLRVGVEIAFGQELRVTVEIGPVKLTRLPKPDKPKKEKKEKKKKKKAAPDQKPAEKKKKKFPFTFADIRSAVPVLFEALQKALGKIRRRMRVDPLDICIIFAGDDPAKVAEDYGWANSAMWTMMPQLERLIHIPDPHIHLGVDYERYDLQAKGRLGISFRVGNLIIIAFTLAVPVLKWYLNWRKKNAPQKEETKNV